MNGLPLAGLSRRPAFLESLLAELAPTPGRGRAAARIVVACVVASTIGLAFHIPQIHWAIITIFTVSQADAGASLVKGLQRIVGTLIGGVAGILIVAIFADQPWIRLPLMGCCAALGLFLSRTTTAPYVGLLSAFTVLIITAAARGPGDAAIRIGILRIVLIAGGVLIGTGAQLVLWPSDPEQTLLHLLAARLATAGRTARQLLDPSPFLDDVEANALTRDGLLRQLDLLASAEARYPSLRRRHMEQVAAIGAAEQVLTAALALARTPRSVDALGEAARRRIEGVARECSRLGDALARRTAPAPGWSEAPPSDLEVASAGGAALLPGLTEMTRALERVAEGLSFLSTPRSPHSVTASPARSPLDEAGRSSFFTPACSMANTADLAFALKGGLAAVLCEVLVSGFAWPGIQTAIWTTVIVAQTSVGSIVQKGLLRLAGASLGGLLGLAAIVVVIPNGETLATIVLTVAVGASVAAWLATGSSRIAYAGVQTGLAFGLCLLDTPGPVTNLTEPRDRVLGVLLGIMITGVVFAAFGPTLARNGLKAAVARVLRALSALAQLGVAAPARALLAPVRGIRWNVYQALAGALQLHEEAGFEAGASRPEVVAERATVLRATNDALTVMLALLAVVRHRLAVDLRALSDPHASFQALGTGAVAVFDHLADRLEGHPASAPPELPALLQRAEETLAADPPGDPVVSAQLRARLALYRSLVVAIDPLTQDVLRLASLTPPFPAHGKSAPARAAPPPPTPGS